MLVGVSAGIGRRIGVDPLAIRIAIVALSLAGGAGILLDLVGWLISVEPTSKGSRPAATITRRVGMVATS